MEEKKPVNSPKRQYTMERTRNIGIAAQDAAHALGGAEILGNDTNRDAGAAAFAGRPVGDRLASPEAALGEDIVELARPLANEVRKDLPLLLAGEIGARRRGGEIELRRVARMLGHGSEQSEPKQ